MIGLEAARFAHGLRAAPSPPEQRLPACEAIVERRTGCAPRRHPPNSPATVIDTVTQTAAPSVIHRPTRAMSRIEK